MRKTKGKLAVILLFCIAILAALIVPSHSTPIAIDKSLERIPAGLYIDYLEDSNGTLTIDDITSGRLDDKWIKSEKEKLTF